VDTDDAPIDGHLKTWIFWAMGVFVVLVAAMLGLVLYALFTLSFSSRLVIEFGLPPTIGVAAVMYLIAGFHRKLQSVSPFRLVLMSTAVFALAAALTWAVVSFVLAHPSRQLELVLRLILLVVLVLLFRVVWKQRKK
jgi:hypothetical protein